LLIAGKNRRRLFAADRHVGTPEHEEAFRTASDLESSCRHPQAHSRLAITHRDSEAIAPPPGPMARTSHRSPMCRHIRVDMPTTRVEPIGPAPTSRSARAPMSTPGNRSAGPRPLWQDLELSCCSLTGQPGTPRRHLMGRPPGAPRAPWRAATATVMAVMVPNPPTVATSCNRKRAALNAWTTPGGSAPATPSRYLQPLARRGPPGTHRRGRPGQSDEHLPVGRIEAGVEEVAGVRDQSVDAALLGGRAAGTASPLRPAKPVSRRVCAAFAPANPAPTITNTYARHCGDRDTVARFGVLVAESGGPVPAPDHCFA
jgi:hypothetical protein